LEAGADEELFQADGFGFFGLQAVEIGVDQPPPRSGVLADEREGGRLDLVRIDAEVECDASRENGLAGSEVAVEEKSGIRGKRCRDLAADGDRFVFARREVAPGGHGSLLGETAGGGREM